jgi:hypothetical protein
MIPKRLSIMLGVATATATVGLALLAPVSGTTAGGGGGGTHGALPTGPNQNPNAGNGGSGSGSKNGSFPTGPNQNPNAGNSSSGSSSSGSGNGGRTPQEDTAWAPQAPAPAAPEAAVPTGGRAVRANDRYVPTGSERRAVAGEH